MSNGNDGYARVWLGSILVPTAGIAIIGARSGVPRLRQKLAPSEACATCWHDAPRESMYRDFKTTLELITTVLDNADLFAP